MNENVDARIDTMSKTELESLKENIQSLETDELTIDELNKVLAGTPLDYEAAKEQFERSVGKK